MYNCINFIKVTALDAKHATYNMQYQITQLLRGRESRVIISRRTKYIFVNPSFESEYYSRVV